MKNRKGRVMAWEKELKAIFNKYCGFNGMDIKAKNAMCRLPKNNEHNCCSGDELAQAIAKLLERHGETWQDVKDAMRETEIGMDMLGKKIFNEKEQ